MNETVIAKFNETLLPLSGNISLIQTIDPNWLYSSIAQSAAAIVGLMGAFLTTKIINQKSIIKELETKINENKARIGYLKDSIKDKEEWVKRIDEEEDLANVKEFLKEMSDEIDLDSPPSIDELIKIADESENEDFHNLNKEMLRESYNQEYLDNVRENREKRKSPFGLGMLRIPDIPLIINPQIAGIKWDRYRKYNDEIGSTYSEIKYLQNLIREKEEDVAAAKAGLDLKNTWTYLALFSIIGVFLPLFMLTLSPEKMYSLKFIVLGIVFISWLLILYYLVKEIRTLKKKDILKSK